MIIKSKNFQQTFFIALGGVFIFSVLAVILYRSSTAVTLLSLGRVLQSTEDPFAALSLGGEEIKLHLKDFHRIQIEKGDVTWDLKAGEARYLPENKVAYVNDPEVVINRKNDKPFNLKAKAGKLYLNGEKMDKAELEGEINFFVTGDFSTKTDYAVLEVEKNEVTSPNLVVVEGEGFQISGRGMNLDLEKKKVRLNSRVRSAFYEDKIKKIKK